MKIGIMTDVNAGLDYINKKTDIICLRSSVNFKNEVLVDGIDIKADEFYERIKDITDKENIPSTSAPALGDIYDAFDYFVEQGYTDVIHFPISFQLSATGPTVKQVALEYQDKLNIIVIDTKLACYLQGYLAVNAEEMAKNGATVQEIVDKSERLIENSQAYFVVNNLNYLVKNGRLSGAAGFFGSLLKIKPVLEISKEGKIVTKEKIKSHRKAVERAIELILEYIDGKENVKLLLLHSLCSETIEEMKQVILSKRPDITDVEIHYITPAVGAHIGAGVVGIGVFIK